MKRLGLLILTVLLSFPVTGKAAEVAHPEITRIKAEDLKQLMDSKSGFILIDSRDSGKYKEGHIEGAINIHFDEAGDPSSRQMSLMALPMDRLIIVYCGCEDEKTGAGLVLELYDMGCDMDNLKILSGGIAQWEKQGYPIKTVGE
jgi:rhodanese-related sulfurtransferase